MDIEDLYHTPIYNHKVKKLVSSLREGILTHDNFHNKKCYAKRSNNLETLLNLTIAWELYKNG